MKNLKEIRTKRKMTQQDVASKLNITQSTYSGYEAGKYEPGTELLIAMSNLFQVSIDYLLGNENEYTIDISNLPDIKKEVLKYYLEQDEYDTINTYRAIKERIKWEKENPEEAYYSKMEAIENQRKEYEIIMEKIKKTEEKERKERELNKKGNK